MVDINFFEYLIKKKNLIKMIYPQHPPLNSRISQLQTQKKVRKI